MKQNGRSASRKLTGKLLSSNIQIAIGYIIAIPCGLSGVSVAFFSNPDATDAIALAVILFICMALGLLQIVRGLKRKKLIHLFRKYETILATNSFRSMEQLATAAGVPVETAEKNIVELFNKGYLENAYLDTEKNCIVFTKDVQTPESESGSAQEKESPPEYVRVTCHNCGAKNKIQKGTVGECEFCGSYLSES